MQITQLDAITRLVDFIKLGDPLLTFSVSEGKDLGTYVVTLSHIHPGKKHVWTPEQMNAFEELIRGLRLRISWFDSRSRQRIILIPLEGSVAGDIKGKVPEPKLNLDHHTQRGGKIEGSGKKKGGHNSYRQGKAIRRKLSDFLGKKEGDDKEGSG